MSSIFFLCVNLNKIDYKIKSYLFIKFEYINVLILKVRVLPRTIPLMFETFPYIPPDFYMHLEIKYFVYKIILYNTYDTVTLFFQLKTISRLCFYCGIYTKSLFF